MTVIKACETLRKMLMSYNIPGSKMIEMLTAAHEYIELTVSELSQAIRANHRRNSIAHDLEPIDVDEATEIVMAFESVARALQARGARRPRGDSRFGRRGT